MRRGFVAYAGMVLALVLASSVRAQATTDVEVKVTSSSETHVYLDKGRAAGLREGDIVVLEPRGAAPVRATITDVSRTHCRARLEDRRAMVALGVTGRVRVPKSRLAKPAETQERPGRRTPEHPPWTGKLPREGDDIPLLAPIRTRGPADRPMRVFGRAWLRATGRDNRFASDNRYLLAGAGTESVVQNPFAYGGEVRFRGDLSYRKSQLEFVPDESTTRFRVDRLSYRAGHASDDTVRFQVGRFLQTLAPELGLVDGAEVDVRVADGSRVGVSFGGFPEPQVDRNSFDDTQATVFYRYRADVEHAFEVGAGFQKTWHRGQADRDLALFDLFWQPASRMSVYANLWVDYYGASAVNKSQGFEVTEFRGGGNWAINDSNGLGVSVDYFVWPELLREEFRPVEPTSLRNDHVLRSVLSTWHVLSDHVRFDFRIAPWEDQSGSGLAGDARMTLSNVLFEQGYVEFDVFKSDGTYEDAVGGRVTVGHYDTVYSQTLALELSQHDYEREPPLSTAFNQAVTASFDWHALSATDLSLNLDYRFGDTQDTLGLGLYLQTRF